MAVDYTQISNLQNSINAAKLQIEKLGKTIALVRLEDARSTYPSHIMPDGTAVAAYITARQGDINTLVTQLGLDRTSLRAFGQNYAMGF